MPTSGDDVGSNQWISYLNVARIARHYLIKPNANAAIVKNDTTKMATAILGCPARFADITIVGVSIIIRI
ncbi:hypothetical protein K5M35_19435, partial [Chromobacterium vaccinii]|nr:hypothetical protein [Chromobacterium vaccinii]